MPRKTMPEIPEFVKPYKHVLTLSEELLYGPGGPFSWGPSNDQSQIRVNNRKAMDRLLYGSDGLTKQELAEKLNLSLPTITGILQEMNQEGLLVTRTGESVGAGRPPVYYSLDRLAHAFASVVIRQEYIRIRITDAFCQILVDERWALPYEDCDMYWEAVSEWVLELYRRAGTMGRYVVGVNLILPCYTDPVCCKAEGNATFSCKALHVETMESRLGAVVYLNNYYEAAAFALGVQQQEERNLCYVSVDSEINCVTIAGGRIFRTRESEPSSAGHLTLIPMGRRCSCGRIGCVRAYCSTEAFEDRYGETVERFTERLGGADKTTTRIVFWHEYLNLLSSFLANQVSAYQMPVVLGGRLAECLGPASSILQCLVSDKLCRPDEEFVRIVKNEEELALQGGIDIVFHNYI